ncbi:TPA: RHS domain-containing protein [Proteus mirabilis]|nr:RHS domain-containing protein [Proteus mirabilis]HEK1983497.1 RHS domain-containing protein [Proteus mirabilis]
MYYTHSSLSGLPEALTNSEGEIVWQGQYSAWGQLQRQTRPTSTFNREQNLRFQGQYFDKETGLHYNTFRYYAPDLGRFTQQDPIGLAGGINLYAYAPNPLTWVDPWGWAKLFALGTYGELNGSVHVGDQLQAHELLRHEYLKQQGLANTSRLSGNPSIALDLDHHTRGPLKDTRGIGGAHWHEAEIRANQGLGKNEFASTLKRELDITSGGLRKSGVPASRVKQLRQEALKFYKQQVAAKVKSCK